MEDKQRHIKLRLLIKQLNKSRKKQAQKIDILCNDLIAAQRDFIKRLGIISFVASFCESIVGTTDLDNLLATAVKLIKAENGETNVTFFLCQGLAQGAEGLQMHMFESSEPMALDRQQLENCFCPELVENICKSNKVCHLKDMFAAGLQGNLTELSKISAVTIPLGQFGSSLGFMLVYRSSQDRLTSDEIQKISAISHGLSRAIASCQTLSRAKL
ncbi:MAG: hypothetical protein ABIF19_00525 [Planctomycetota bacterium]